MKIGITLDEVLRDFLGQFVYVYNKYKSELGPVDYKEGDIKSLDLLEYFKFSSQKELNQFLYSEAPLEIFGHADQMSDGLMTQFNHFLLDLKYDNQHEVEIISREVNKSISGTYFFLSKTGCLADRIRFEQDSLDLWNGVDIIITANPTVLENKPNGKLSVKVESSYNTNSPADFSIKSLLDFIKDEELRDKILNTKITSYEELN